jgi:hypothetical protein
MKKKKDRKFQSQTSPPNMGGVSPKMENYRKIRAEGKKFLVVRSFPHPSAEFHTVPSRWPVRRKISPGVSWSNLALID